MASYKIDGFVSEGYERVRDQFEKNFIDGLEECAQLCVYVGEEVVIDLWGNVNRSVEYDGDTITCVFSSTKPLAAICIAKLVDKKLLDYNDKIIKHWPEYGYGDKEKERITVSDVLRHEGGMATFTKTIRADDTLRENIIKNSIGSIIENEPLKFPSRKDLSKADYHDGTYGLILNEIFRRVETQHRTIGEYLRDEICNPLNVDCYIGLAPEQLSKSYNPSASSLGSLFLSSFVPKFLGRKTELNTFDLFKLLAFIWSNAHPLYENTPKNIQDAVLYLTTDSVIKVGENPSHNGQCSARGLAKIAAMMANEGTIDGKKILSRETLEKFHSFHKQCKNLNPVGIKVNFSQGGVNYFRADKTMSNNQHELLTRTRDGYIGWLGAGGSVFQWCIDYKIGFAYVPTFLAWEDIHNTQAGLLQKTVLDCVKDLQNKPK